MLIHMLALAGIVIIVVALIVDVRERGLRAQRYALRRAIAAERARLDRW